MRKTTRAESEALERAVELAGSQAKLAAAIGVSQPSIWKMVNQAKRASVDYVLAIEAATGVSRHDLRPDIYPREDPPAHPPETTGFVSGGTSSPDPLEAAA